MHKKHINILAIFLISLFTSGIVLKFHLFAVPVLLVLGVALSIFFAPKCYILFWLVFAAISDKIVLPGLEITSYGLMNILFLPSLILKLLMCYKSDFFRFPVWKPYLLFLLVVFISIWYSSGSYFMGVRKYFNLVIPFCFSLLMVSVVKKRIVLKEYLRVVLLSASAMGVIGTIMYSLKKWVVYINVPRATGILGWPNDYALFLNINLAIALSLAMLLNDRKEKILYFALSFILACSVVPTFSKGGYIGTLLIGFLVVIFAGLKKQNLASLISLFLALSVACAGVLYKYSDIIFYRIGNNESFHSRLVIWESIVRKFWEHPIIGSGFRSSLDMVQYLSPYKSLTSTHNLFLQILLEVGIIGVAVFMIAYFSMFRYALKRLFSPSKHYTNALAVGFVSLFVAAFVYSFVGNAFLNSIINLYVWIYFSFLICFDMAEDEIKQTNLGLKHEE